MDSPPVGTGSPESIRHLQASGYRVAWNPYVQKGIYPLVMTNIAMERSTIFNGKTHKKIINKPFSMALWNYLC